MRICASRLVVLTTKAKKKQRKPFSFGARCFIIMGIGIYLMDFIPNRQWFAQSFGAEFAFLAFEMIKGLLHFAKTQIKKRQVAAYHHDVGKVTEIPKGAEVETDNIRNHAKGQYCQIYQPDCHDEDCIV